jgi:hypothetical protein
VSGDWNPRYVAYAKAHGRTPDEQLRHDGSMAGFINWIAHQWTDYCQSRGLPPGYQYTESLHEDFDAWLATQTARAASLADVEDQASKGVPP